MHSDKKLTKEDTWRPAELRRHLREEGHSSDGVRRRDENERKHRVGDSTDRFHRDPEKESKRERDRHRERQDENPERESRQERDRHRERRSQDERDRDVDRRKEGSRDRRGDKDRDRREERERRRERDGQVDGGQHRNDSRENRDRRHDREYKHDRERDRDKEKRREKQREREHEGDRSNGRQDRDRDRRKEERDQEHKTERERRRHEERELRERHWDKEKNRDEYDSKRSDRERRERTEERKHSEPREDRGYKDKDKKSREERRIHKERGYSEEKSRHGGDPREHGDGRGLDEEFRRRHGDRKEEKEGRRHRDRRHREEKDGERRHRDRTGSKRASSDKSPSHETKNTKPEEKHLTAGAKDADRTEPVVNDEQECQDTQEYDDDFEDYEEDFEEDDGNADEGEEDNAEYPEAGEDMEELTVQRQEEIRAIQRAMDEENEKVGTPQSRPSTSREGEEGPGRTRGSEMNQSRTSQHGKYIDFRGAKQREVSKKVASKQKKRSTELLRLIDLDFSMTFSLLELPPVNEYDMYIRNFGNANTRQAYVQCNEDNTDRDIQTEDIKMCEKWTQHPPEYSKAFGDPNPPDKAQDKTASRTNFDSRRLVAFLRSASQVMVVLLEEDQAERTSFRKLRTETDTLPFSDGSLQLNTRLPFLHGRQISLVHFSQVQRHTMISVHEPKSVPRATSLDSSTVICIWNIWEPSRPQKILLYESEVRCCCFSPGKAILVFAGTSVGSVVLWDLREQAGSHCSLKIGDEEWAVRQPTFSTDAVCSAHFSSVTSVEVVPSTVATGPRPEVLRLASEEESSGLSFQLASLDESGLLNFWVVVQLPKANEAGSQTDLGLRPGGKVKLLHSSSHITAARASPQHAAITGPLQALNLKFLPTDSNHFFIGTNGGLVSHGTSHGLKAPPKFYSFQDSGAQPVDISSIHFSPFRPSLFLVGCSDGSVRLHAVNRQQPVAEWRNRSGGQPVLALQWHQTRPTVFCVLDVASTLHIWDLMKNDAEPVISEKMTADRVTAMALFGDSGRQNTYSGIAVAHESGKIEMHYFNRNFTTLDYREEIKLERMITEAF